MSARIFLIVSLVFTLSFNVAWAWPTTWLSIIAAAACTLIVPAGLTLWPQVPAHTIPRRILRALVMCGVCAAAIITSFSHSVVVLLAQHWTDWTAWSVTGGAELLVALSTMAVHAPSVRVPDVLPSSRPDVQDVTQDVRDVAPALPQDVLSVSRDDVPATGQDVPQSSRPAVPLVPRDDVPDVPQSSRLVVPVRPEQDGQDEQDVPVRPEQSSRDERRRASELRAWLSERYDNGEGEPSLYAVRKRFGCSQPVAARLLEMAKAEPTLKAV